MALEFQSIAVATIKGTATNSEKTYTIKGVTANATTVANAATQINKILGIGNLAIAADETMTRTIEQEAVENG